ncbi:Hint domain-containing protein [Mesobacterium pallidum]|uniref:Hint domain-containing protein n=1 Tax=Mesobacterium pallidum TaxID=2872037 RepID=UPI001EE1CE9D|nr:Hint domain-containing protein [Mesobacterium pallidum]
MATFDFSSYLSYKTSSTTYNYQAASSTNATGTLSDGGLGDGSTFELNEELLAGYDYVGTVTVGGVTAVLVKGNGNDYRLYSSLDQTTALSTFGTSFQQSVVSTDPVTPCFLTGTLIATDKGEVAVEDLAIGDMVKTADGDLRPILWIGTRVIDTRFGPAERLRPVRFAAGSLGNGLPHSDLMVTADHAMLVVGILAHAGALVNGTSITSVPLAELGQTYTVYHIETEHQELILANGAIAESFVDNMDRSAFDNYDQFVALYGKGAPVQELDLPRAMSPRQLPLAARRMLGLTEAA